MGNYHLQPSWASKTARGGPQSVAFHSRHPSSASARHNKTRARSGILTPFFLSFFLAKQEKRDPSALRDGRPSVFQGRRPTDRRPYDSGAHHQQKKSSLARSCVGHSESKSCTLGFLLLHRCFKVIYREGKNLHSRICMKQ